MESFRILVLWTKKPCQVTLQHHPHHSNVVLDMSPVALGIQIALAGETPMSKTRQTSSWDWSCYTLGLNMVKMQNMWNHQAVDFAGIGTSPHQSDGYLDVTTSLILQPLSTDLMNHKFYSIIFILGVQLSMPRLSIISSLQLFRWARPSDILQQTWDMLWYCGWLRNPAPVDRWFIRLSHYL